MRKNYKKLYEDLLEENKENVLIESMNNMKEDYLICEMKYHKILEQNIQLNRIVIGIHQISNFLMNEYTDDSINSLFELIHYLTDI